MFFFGGGWCGTRLFSGENSLCSLHYTALPFSYFLYDPLNPENKLSYRQTTFTDGILQLSTHVG